MDAVWNNADVFLAGFILTLKLFVVSGVASVLLGIVLAVLRTSPIRVLRVVATTYVEIVRNAPLVAIFFMIVFGLPELGPRLSYFSCANIALTIYFASHFCEAVRSGIKSVPPGQIEAARAIGLRSGKAVFMVVMPQAVRAAIPSILNFMVLLIKDTSIAGAFGVFELFGTTERVLTENPQSVLVLLAVASVLYLLITIPTGTVAKWLERRRGVRAR